MLHSLKKPDAHSVGSVKNKKTPAAGTNELE